MAANYQIAVLHGPAASPSYVVWPAGGIFHAGDSTPTAVGSAVQIQIPSGGAFAYSYRKNVWLDFTSAPVGVIRNLRVWFGPEAQPTGVLLFVGTSANYTEAVPADLTTLYPGAVDASVYTQANPLVLQAGTVLTNPQTGRGTQPFLILQERIASTAAQGLSTARSFTYMWEET
jgi:hypothetical protein